MIKEPPKVVELPMPERGLMALKVAMQKAIEEHAREGLPIYVWPDGKVVEIPPMNCGRNRSSWARNQSKKPSSYMSLFSEVLALTGDKVL